MLLPLRCLVDFRNLGNTVSLLLDLFSALFLVRFLKIPAPFGFHLLKPFMVHTFRPLLFLEYFFRASVLHGIEIVEGLFRGLLADFESYRDAHVRAGLAYRDPKRWNKMALMNIARSGIFAADRSIADYADTIWHVPYKK